MSRWKITLKDLSVSPLPDLVIANGGRNLYKRGLLNRKRYKGLTVNGNDIISGSAVKERHRWDIAFEATQAESFLFASYLALDNSGVYCRLTDEFQYIEPEAVLVTPIVAGSAVATTYGHQTGFGSQYKVKLEVPEDEYQSLSGYSARSGNLYLIQFTALQMKT